VIVPEPEPQQFVIPEELVVGEFEELKRLEFEATDELLHHKSELKKISDGTKEERTKLEEEKIKLVKNEVESHENELERIFDGITAESLRQIEEAKNFDCGAAEEAERVRLEEEERIRH
jgi:hypothetical protein